MALKSELLKIPGAHLYYELQGSGPLLLMIPGGPADAGVFAPVAAILSNHYLVVPYDPRGNSRSVLDGPAVDQDMNVHGDDAARLIEALSREPANVLGSSGGAQIGLNLAARHPRLVRTLVAHEPPCLELLPDATEQRAFMNAVLDAYRKDGAGAAVLKFQEGTGLNVPPPSNVSPEVMEMFARIGRNFDFFFAHGVKPISSYLPEVETLRSGSPRIVVGVGETSKGQLAYRAAFALAGRLGIEPASFPGGHNGFGEEPAAFAERLHQVLANG